MNSYLPDFVLTTSKLTGLSPQVVQEGTLIILIVGLVFASIHLITLLITRWGDRHATSKSLVFSILMHLCCSFGVLVTAPTLPNSAVDTEEEHILVSEVVSTEKNTHLDDSAHKPIWEQLSETKLKDLDRNKLLDPQMPSEVETIIHDPKIVATIPEQLPHMTPKEQVYRPNLLKSEDQSNDKFSKSPELFNPDFNPKEGSHSNNGVNFARTNPLKTTNMDLNDQTPTKGNNGKFQPDITMTNSTPIFNNSKLDSSQSITPTDQSTFLSKKSSPTFDLNNSDTGSKNGSNTKVNNSPRGFARTSVKRNGSGFKEKGFTRPGGGKNTNPNSNLPPGLVSSLGMNNGNFNATPPGMVKPGDDALLLSGKQNIPTTYKLRNPNTRGDTAKKFGGSESSEIAVELSLKWLASIQEPGGYWDGVKFGAGAINEGP